MKVDIWTDIVCPFCYIGNVQFKKALGNFAHKDHVEIMYHSYQLMPGAPTKPTGKKAYEDLAQLKGDSVTSFKEQFSQVALYGKREGLDMKMLETILVDTFDGHRFIHFAAEKNKLHEALFALFEAYFSDTANIADTRTLVAVAKKIGPNEKECEAALKSDKFVDAVKTDIQKAAALGIQGVPFFVIDDTYGISGARGVDEFTMVLEKVWKESHPLHMINNDTSMMCTEDNCI